jgi:hypothetical protein
MLPAIVKAKDLEVLAANLPKLTPTKWDLDPTWLTYERAQIVSCRGPAGGAPVAGVGGGGGVCRAHPAGQTPQLGAAGRDSHQDTETQTNTFCEYPAGPCALLPLAHFGATYLRRV